MINKRTPLLFFMPQIDAHLFNKKGVKKFLKLELEDGEGILESIKQGMKENNLKEVKIEKIEGPVEEILLNYFEKGTFKSNVIKDTNIMLASGNFKLSYGDLFGQTKVVTNNKPPVHGSLVRGKAKDGLKLSLSFLDLVENGD